MCTLLGEEGQKRMRNSFNKFLDGLKPNGFEASWKLQEQGKIPVRGAFMFYMRLSGLTSLRTGDYLQHKE